MTSFDTMTSSSSSLEERYFYDLETDSDETSNDENHQIRPDLNENDEFYKHIVLPTDTLQGICLQYKVSSTKLKQINRFSGSTLILAPNILTIPKQPGVSSTHQNTESKEYKIYYIHANYPQMKLKEIKEHLENHDWNLINASNSIKDMLHLDLTRQQSGTLVIDTFKTRNKMVDGITKEIPLSFFGQSIDMNSISYGASGFMNACLGMDYGDIEMKELNMT